MRRALVTCAVAVLATTSAGAAATTGWEPPRSLGTAGGPCCFYWHGYVALGADARGDTVAAWSDPARKRIEFAVSVAGSPWRRLHAVSGRGLVSLDVSRNGRVVLASAEPRLQVRTAQLPDVRWSKPHVLPGEPFDVLTADADDHGPAAVVWQRQRGHRLHVYAAVAPTFHPVALDGARAGEGPVVARGTDGSLSVAWAQCVERRGCAGRDTFPAAYRIALRELTPAGRWRPEATIRGRVKLLNRTIQFEHGLVPDVAGGLTYVWESSTWPVQDTLAALHRDRGESRWTSAGPVDRLAGQTWQTPSGDNFYDGNLQTDTNAHGDAIASWLSEVHTGVASVNGLAFRAAGSTEWRPVALPPEIEDASLLDSSGAARVVRFVLADSGEIFVAAVVNRRRPQGPELVAGTVAAPGEPWQLTTLETFRDAADAELRPLVATAEGAAAIWTRKGSGHRSDIRVTSFRGP